jgi:hypothetical protein
MLFWWANLKQGRVAMKPVKFFGMLLVMFFLTPVVSMANGDCHPDNMPSLRFGALELKATDWESTCPPDVVCIWENPRHQFELSVDDPMRQDFDMFTLWLHFETENEAEEPYFLGDFFFATNEEGKLAARFWIPEVQLYDNALEFEVWESHEHDEPVRSVFNVSSATLLELAEARMSCEVN